jgi:hypothetical protein
MLAAIRPDDQNLPLFLHVLGATLIFGATAAMAIAGFAGRARSDHQPLLARVTFRTFLFGVIPAWLLMRIAAEWIAGKEFPDGAETPGWLELGYPLSEGSGVLLLVAGILAWLSVRRGRVFLAVPVLASIVVVALGVAWFAMSAKP